MSFAAPCVSVSTGDAKKGAQLFKSKCLQCHSTEEGRVSTQGPPLFGHGSLEANNISGIVWSETHKHLIKPKFASLKKDKERADIIAYMGACK